MNIDKHLNCSLYSSTGGGAYLNVVSSVWLEYPLLLRTCRFPIICPLFLDFLDGYGFLVSDGEVSEDELDSSMPGLPTSATNIPFHISIVQLCWLTTVCVCIPEGVKQSCVPWADVLAQVPYIHIRYLLKIIFLYQIIESWLELKLSRFINIAC